MSTPQSSLHSAFAVLDSGRELRTARAEVETKVPERTSALPRSEREHCDVVDILPAIVWSALPDGSNVYVNSRFVEYSGMSAEQLAGSGWHAATHPDDLQRHERKWLACVRTCEVFEDEVRFRRADGQYRWHLQRGVPLRDEDGNILKWYGVLTDIEDRKRAEEKIQEQEIELRQILDVVPQLIAVYGPNQERLYANRNALEYLGMSLDEWLQIPSVAEVHPYDVEKLWAFEDRGSSSYDLEVRVRKGDGSFRCFLIRFSAPRDEKGQLMRWYVACTDIEDRKRAEEKLQQENVALREEIDKASMFEQIVGTSSSLKAVLSRIAKVAPTDSTVLITGNQPIDAPMGHSRKKKVPQTRLPGPGEITNEDRFRSEAHGVGIRRPSRGHSAHCLDTLGDQGLGAGATTTHCRGRNRRAEGRSRLWRMDWDSHGAGECRRKSAGHRLSTHSEI